MQMSNTPILIQETGTQGKNCRLGCLQLGGPALEDEQLVSLGGQGQGRGLENWVLKGMKAAGRETQRPGEVRERGEVTAVPWGWLMRCFEV